MNAPSPARAALPLLVLALVLLSSIAGLYVALGWNADAEQQEKNLASETELFLSAVESGTPSLERMAERYFENAATDSTEAPPPPAETPSIFVVDRNAEPRLLYRPPSDAARASAEEAVDWQMHLAAESEPVLRVTLNGQPFVVATRAARNGRAYLALVAPAVQPSNGSLLLLAVGAVVLSTLLLGVVAVAMLRKAGQGPVGQVEAFVRKLAELTERGGEPQKLSALKTEADTEVGSVAEPLFRIVGNVGEVKAERDEARSHLNALFQVHTSYVLLVTMNGTIVDANPAFYAISGLPPETVRGAPAEMLDEVMPLEPVLRLAHRSQTEGAAFADIDYAIKAHDDTTRPLKLSLLAVRSDGHPAVLVVAADKMKERTLEQQIETFSDSLDVMVDKRVEELANGHERVDALVASTGAVLIAFDRTGATRRWNTAAQRLTGRGIEQVPHINDLPRMLGLDEAETSTFSAWLFGESTEPCAVTIHANTEAATTYVWKCARLDVGDLNERRVLVGLVLPSFEEEVDPDALREPTVAEVEALLRQEMAEQQEMLRQYYNGTIEEAIADAIEGSRQHLQVLLSELAAPLDSVRTYSLRLQSMPNAFPAEVQTCLQMIDGATQLFESIVGRVAHLQQDALPEGDSLPDSFMSDDAFADVEEDVSSYSQSG